MFSCIYVITLILHFRPTNSLNIETIVPIISNFPSTRARLLGLRQLFIEKLSAPKKQRSVVNCVQSGIYLIYIHIFIENYTFFF